MENCLVENQPPKSWMKSIDSKNPWRLEMEAKNPWVISGKESLSLKDPWAIDNSPRRNTDESAEMTNCHLTVTDGGNRRDSDPPELSFKERVSKKNVLLQELRRHSLDPNWKLLPDQDKIDKALQQQKLKQAVYTQMREESHENQPKAKALFNPSPFTGNHAWVNSKELCSGTKEIVQRKLCMLQRNGERNFHRMDSGVY